MEAVVVAVEEVLVDENNLSAAQKKKIYDEVRRAQEVANAVWYKDVPTGPENPSRQWPLINSNFKAIEGAINNNHYDISDIQKRGLHTRIDLFPYDNPPPPIACTPQFATFYTLKNGKIYFRNDKGETFDILGELKADRKGFMVLPGGFMVQWDRVDNVGNGAYMHFERTFPRACLGVWPVLIRGNNEQRSCHVESYDQIRWRIRTNASGTTVLYHAIGW